MNKRIISAGQITITLAAALTGSTLLVSGLSAYFGSQLAFKDEITNVRINTQANASDIIALEKREENRDERLDRLEDKIDALLIRNGVNPNTVK